MTTFQLGVGSLDVFNTYTPFIHCAKTSSENNSPLVVDVQILIIKLSKSVVMRNESQSNCKRRLQSGTPDWYHSTRICPINGVEVLNI